MAEAVKKDRFTYQQQSRNFMLDLRRFHDQRGTAFSSPPSIAGREVDLYLLYTKVTGDGGYEKVNNEDKWEDFHHLFRLPVGITNASQALKLVYSRYLYLYEKLHYLGEDPDQPEAEDEAGPLKNKTPAVVKVAMSYNYRQHLIAPALRQNNGLSRDVRQPNLYERLEKSLLSGLPNEVDFALNVCTLLSNEGRHVLHLDRTNNLMALIMAHVGVYDESDGSFLEFHQEWMKLTGRNFIKFWCDSIHDTEVRDLIFPGHVKEASWDREDRILFNKGRELGMGDVEGQRIMQLASLIQNLSFEVPNQRYMAANILVFRFVLLCIYSQYGGLHQTGLDTMANICNQLILEPIDCWTTEIILKTVVRCLASSDKQDILKGMEILTNLCQVDENDQMISEHLEPRAYKNIIQQLLVADIQLLIHTLEVLYQLSELGEQTTDHIAAVPDSVDVLVSLVTVEAGSFGPGALQGIRVVEYTVPAPTPVSTQQQQQGQAPPPGASSGASSSGAPPQPINQRETPILADPEALATCATWFKCNFEGHPLCSVNKAEIYKVYVDCMQRHNFSIVNPADFMKAIKLVYPEKMTIAHVQRSNGTMDIVLKGMRRRPILREFPPPKEGRHKNSYNFLKQAQAVSNVPRVSSPGPSGSSGSPRPLLPLAGPILPPLSPHMSPPPSPATPPPHRYQSPQPSKNTMVKNLLVSRVSNSVREHELKRRATSPLPTGKVKAARSLSPSYEENCHLEVCGDVERAQDVVRTEQLVHEARIERIENQCANNNTDSSNRNGLNGHIGPMGDGVQNGPLNELTNRIESQKAVKKDGSSKLVNGVVENGDHDRLVNGYLSEDSNLVPSTGAEDQDELLMAINNISQDNDDDQEEVETTPIVFKADVQPVLNDALSDSQSLPGLVDEDTTDGFSGEPVLNGPQTEVMDIQTIEYDADAADNVVNGVAEDENENQRAVTMMMTNGQMDGNDDSEDDSETGGDDVANDVIPETVAETSVGISALPEQVAAASTEGKPEKSSVHVRKLTQGVEIVKSSDLTDGNGESEKDNDDEEDCSGDIMQEAMKEIFGSGSDLDVDENSRSSIDTTQSIPPTQQPIRIVSNTVQSGTVLQTGTVVQPGTLLQSGTVVQPGTTVLQSGATVLQNGAVVQPGTTVMPRTVMQSGNTFVQPGTTVIPRTIIPQGAVMQQPGGTLVQQGAVMQSLQTNTVVSSVQTGTVVGIPANASNVIILTNSAGGASSVVGGTSTRLVIQPNMVGKPLQITIPAGQKQQIAIATPQGAVTATAKVVTAIPQTVVSSTGNIIQTCGLVTSSAHNVIQNGPALAPNSQPLTLTPQGQVITKLITTSSGQLLQPSGAPAPMMAPQALPPVSQGASTTMKKLPLPQVKPKPGVTANLKAAKKAEKMIPIDKVENMCEWDGCKKCFENAKDVFYHVYKHHLKAYGSGPCLWECCDRLYRQRFSLVTHVQDRHCSDSAMRSATQRRVRPPTPTSGAPAPPPPPPPIYPHDAAVQAIRRFSARPPYQEFMEAKEGPVTKHIRLTSALILRNLARYSAAGRSLIKKYEHRLSYLALSPVEASTPISNCLWELHQHH